MNMKIKYQKGMTLMELLVAGVISIIVSSGMVILMASTLGTGTQTIKMTQLSKEMRSAMQIMTRELRRANYHASFATCFGDIGCLGAPSTDFPNRLNILGKITEININGTNDCFWFWYDRPQPVGGTQVAVNNETVAGFRRTVIDSVGVLQMSVSGTSAASCPTAGWVDITNSDLVDVEGFNVENDVLGFESYALTINGSQSIERIGITMTGRLREDDASLPAWMRSGSDLPLTIRDFIRVRNDTVSL